MATKGTIAKDEVVKRIAEAFGDDYIGISNKKIIVWANEGKERMQISITLARVVSELDPNEVQKEPSLTPPPIKGDNENVVFIQSKEDKNCFSFGTKPKSNGLSKEEKETVAKLLKELGM